MSMSMTNRSRSTTNLDSNNDRDQHTSPSSPDTVHQQSIDDVSG